MKNNSIKYKCPRCDGEYTIDYGETFQCVKCLLEFYKEDMKMYEKSDILAISELSAFIKIFTEN